MIDHKHSDLIRKYGQPTIEHVHNQMAVFTIGHCSNLTRLAWANQKACGLFLINRPALLLWFLCVLIGQGWARQIWAIPNSTDNSLPNSLIMDMLDNTSLWAQWCGRPMPHIYDTTVADNMSKTIDLMTSLTACCVVTDEVIVDVVSMVDELMK